MISFARVLFVLLLMVTAAACGGGGSGGGGAADADVGMVEETYGQFTFDGVQFRWTIQDNTVMVNIWVNYTQYFQVALAPVSTRGLFDFSFCCGRASGMLVIKPKTASSAGMLEAKNLTVTQNGQTRTFTGVMGTW